MKILSFIMVIVFLFAASGCSLYKNETALFSEFSSIIGESEQETKPEAPLKEFTPGDYIKTDLSYGDDSFQKLDLYLSPDIPSDAGLMLYIHGGAWHSGDKSEFTSFCEKSKENRYAAATINYRLTDSGAGADEMLEDIGLALKKIKEEASAMGINIKSCAVTGFSAGAHLALLYSFRFHDTAPIPVSFTVSLSGASDFLDNSYYESEKLHSKELITECYGKAAYIDKLTAENRHLHKDALAEISPVTYIDENVPPVIICHGSADGCLPFTNSGILSSVLDKNSVKNKFIVYKDCGHNLSGDEQAHIEYEKTLSEWCKEAFGY